MKILTGLRTVSNDLHTLFTKPWSSGQQIGDQLVGITSSRKDNEQVAQATYSPECEWGFGLWPILLPSPERGDFPGCVRFQRQEALQSSRHRDQGSDQHTSETASARTVSGAEESSFTKPANQAKKPDGHAIWDLTQGSCTYSYSVMLQESKDDSLSKFQDDFVKSCKEAANSIAMDSRHFKCAGLWLPADREGMRACPFPPKYIYQVSGGELHIFALEAADAETYLVYQVAAGNMASTHSDRSEKIDLLPSVGIPMKYGELLFASFAILRQLQEWYKAVDPKICGRNSGNIVPAKFQQATPNAKSSQDGSRSQQDSGASKRANTPGPAGRATVGGRQQRQQQQQQQQHQHDHHQQHQLQLQQPQATPSTFLRPFGTGAEDSVCRALELRYELGDVMWDQPHSAVWKAIRRADGKPVVLKRCRLDTALATLRADYLLRSSIARNHDDERWKEEQRATSGHSLRSLSVGDGSRGAYSYDACAVPVLECFFDAAADDDSFVAPAPSMATLVFPQLDEVCVPGQSPWQPSESLAWFWDFAIQLSDRVAEMHAHQLSHGDLKPLNILRDGTSGRLVLIDLGQSKYPLHLGVFQSWNGTDNWRCPYSNHGQVSSEAADCWSLGAVILHALLCAENRATFTGPIMWPYDDRMLQTACEVLRRWYGGDATWVEGLRQALFKNVSEYCPLESRYSAADLRDALRRLYAEYEGR